MRIRFETSNCAYFIFFQVWFKNRRVKAKKQSPPVAKFQPSISANQSNILQPWYYSLNEVQMENWACSSSNGFVSETIRRSGMSRPLSGSPWLFGQSSRMYTHYDSSAAGSFETAALSYGSSGRQLSNYSNVPWIDTAPYQTARLPLDRQVDQRVPEGSKGQAPQQWVQRNGPLASVPLIESQITVKTYSTVPWIDTAQSPRSSVSLTFNNQGERIAPDDKRAQQWDQRNGPRTIASRNQITETSHSVALMGPPQSPGHELEYTSLRDDVLAVVKLDLATQNNKADPSFLDNVRSNMQ